MVFPSLLLAPFSTRVYFSVLYICVFPSLEDKQRFKFWGVISILDTHFILMFFLDFSSFMR